jgi:hypothetical protein
MVVDIPRFTNSLFRSFRTQPITVKSAVFRLKKWAMKIVVFNINRMEYNQNLIYIAAFFKNFCDLRNLKIKNVIGPMSMKANIAIVKSRMQFSAVELFLPTPLMQLTN